MSDHLDARLSDQGATARGAEVVSWGSTDALEAVKRICQDVALRVIRPSRRIIPATFRISRSARRVNGGAVILDVVE
jgi:hypothetical protein